MRFSGPALIKLIHAVHDKGASFRLRAGGFSMYPVIRDGDWVLIGRLTGAKPGIGDIAAFVHPDNGELMIHRIIGMEEGLYLLKGDNVSGDDGCIPEANIIGLVREIQRSAWWKRNPLSFLRDALLDFRSSRSRRANDTHDEPLPLPRPPHQRL